MGKRFFATEAGAMAILDATQTAKFSLDGHALRVGRLDHRLRDLDVVLVGRRRLAVFHQGAIHHHAGKVERDRTPAGVR